MGNNLCIWMLCLYIRNIFRLNTLMCRAKSIIINKILLRYLTCNIVSQITVRDKENILLWQFLYNLNCICGSNTNIRILLKCCSRIDVTYYCKIIVFRTDLLYRLDFCHMRHRTIRIHIRH